MSQIENRLDTKSVLSQLEKKEELHTSRGGYNSLKALLQGTEPTLENPQANQQDLDRKVDVMIDAIQNGGLRGVLALIPELSPEDQQKVAERVAKKLKVTQGNFREKIVSIAWRAASILLIAILGSAAFGIMTSGEAQAGYDVDGPFPDTSAIPAEVPTRDDLELVNLEAALKDPDAFFKLMQENAESSGGLNPGVQPTKVVLPPRLPRLGGEREILQSDSSIIIVTPSADGVELHINPNSNAKVVGEAAAIFQIYANSTPVKDAVGNYWYEVPISSLAPGISLEGIPEGQQYIYVLRDEVKVLDEEALQPEAGRVATPPEDEVLLVDGNTGGPEVGLPVEILTLEAGQQELADSLNTVEREFDPNTYEIVGPSALFPGHLEVRPIGEDVDLSDGATYVLFDKLGTVLDGKYNDVENAVVKFLPEGILDSNTPPGMPRVRFGAITNHRWYADMAFFPSVFATKPEEKVLLAEYRLQEITNFQEVLVSNYEGITNAQINVLYTDINTADDLRFINDIRDQNAVHVDVERDGQGNIVTITIRIQTSPHEFNSKNMQGEMDAYINFAAVFAALDSDFKGLTYSNALLQGARKDSPYNQFVKLMNPDLTALLITQFNQGRRASGPTFFRLR